VIEYFIDRVAAEVGLTTVSGRREVTGRVLALLKRVGDPIERNLYLQRLAQMVGLEERVLTEALQREPVRRSVARPTLGNGDAEDGSARLPIGGLEAELLGLLFRYPSLVSELPDELPLGDATARALGIAWRSRASAAGASASATAAELEAFVGELDAASADLARDLLGRMAAAGASVLQFDQEMARAALRVTLLRLREQRVDERIRSGRVLLEEAQRDGDRTRLQEIERKLDELGREKADVTKAMREPAPVAGGRRS
jgi:DNA primase